MPLEQRARPRSARTARAAPPAACSTPAREPHGPGLAELQADHQPAPAHLGQQLVLVRPAARQRLAQRGADPLGVLRPGARPRSPPARPGRPSSPPRWSRTWNRAPAPGPSRSTPCRRSTPWPGWRPPARTRRTAPWPRSRCPVPRRRAGKRRTGRCGRCRVCTSSQISSAPCSCSRACGRGQEPGRGHRDALALDRLDEERRPRHPCAARLRARPGRRTG